MEILVVLVAVVTAQGSPLCSTYCKALLSGLSVRWRSDCDCSLNQVTYQPNDTSIFYKPANYETNSDTFDIKSEFLITNPTMKQRPKNSITLTNLKRKAEKRKTFHQSIEKPNILYRYTTKMPITSIKKLPDNSNLSYFDIDFNLVNEIRNIKYSPKYYGLLERNLTECIELHILKYIRNCSSTDIRNKYEIDDSIDYTDEELQTEINDKCKEIAEIVDKSIKEIKEKWTKKKPSTYRHDENVYESQLEEELQTELNTVVSTETFTVPSLSSPKMYVNTELNTSPQLDKNTLFDYFTNTEETTTSSTTYPKIHMSVRKKLTPITEVRTEQVITTSDTNTVSLEPNYKKDSKMVADFEKKTVTLLNITRPHDTYINETMVENLAPTTLASVDVSPDPKIENVSDQDRLELVKYPNDNNNDDVSMILPDQQNTTSESILSNQYIPRELTAMSVPEVIKNHTEEHLETEKDSMHFDSTNTLKDKEQGTHTSEIVISQNVEKIPSDSIFTVPSYKNYNDSDVVNENINDQKYRDGNNLNRPIFDEKEVPVIRIVTREYPNGTVFSEVNGTELLPNDDFRNSPAITNLHMKNMKVNNATKYFEKIYHFIVSHSINTTKEQEESKTDTPDDITSGRLYFLYKNQQMPARFVQNREGKIKIGIDIVPYCDKIAQSVNNLTLLGRLCKCVETSD